MVHHRHNQVLFGVPLVSHHRYRRRLPEKEALFHRQLRHDSNTFHTDSQTPIQTLLTVILRICEEIRLLGDANSNKKGLRGAVKTCHERTELARLSEGKTNHSRARRKKDGAHIYRRECGEEWVVSTQ